MNDELNPEGSTFQRLAASAAPFGSLYTRVSRLSWWIALGSAAIIFALIPHWYIGLPAAILGYWISQGLNGASWAVVRGALFWSREPGDDSRHVTLHRLAILILLVGGAIGVAAFVYVPNWTDFQFNGHPSLVAVAGSLMVGVVALSWGFGLTAFALVPICARVLGLPASFFLRRNGRGEG